MSQESEQAQEAWADKRKQMAFEYSELPQFAVAYKVGAAEFNDAYKAALKAEIEPRIKWLEGLDFNSGLDCHEMAELKELKRFLSLLDTVTPIDR